MLAAAPLSDAEALQVVRAIKPRFREFVLLYDTKKYWPDVYEGVLRQFGQPVSVSPVAIRDALLWKYGHLGKPAIPPAHEVLISQVQAGWTVIARSLPPTPQEAFEALDRRFGGRTRFITVAFLLHLLHPRTVPIIDQHNFRAINDLLSSVRPSWQGKKRASTYTDIARLGAFMEAILQAWSRQSPQSLPSSRELDLFLMMYGKAIKKGSNKRL
jgi:hypothetical protein